MKDHDIHGENRYYAPTEDQLNRLGKIFGEKLKSSTARATILGTSNDNWSFLIEGPDVLVCPDGFVRRPDMLILPGLEEWSLHEERSFILATGRSLPEENQSETDVFKVSIFKNTNIVSTVSKAVITQEGLEFLEYRHSKELRKKIESGEDIIDAYVTGTNDYREAIFREIESQLEYGACSSSEVTELIDILEHSIPNSADPISELLRQYIE